MTPFSTDRLILRPVGADDLPEIHRLLYADSEVAFWWTSPPGITLEEVTERWATRLSVKEGQPGWLAVVRRDDDRLLGIVAFQRYQRSEDTSYIVFEGRPNRLGADPDFIEAELTYAFGREYWGQGYATEACRAMIDYGFHELGIGRLVNSVSSANARSVNLMKRLGFRIEPNLHPRPHVNLDAPGVIGLLDGPGRERWRAEVLAPHRWGCHGEQAAEELARLHTLWEAARPLDDNCRAIADDIAALEICNWNLEESILALCRAIGRKEPAPLPIGHLASVSAERWQQVWAYDLALRRWLRPLASNGYGALLAACDPAGSVRAYIGELLGERTPLKELYVERFCLCLERWLGGALQPDSAQGIAHEAAVQAVDDEIAKHDPDGQILAAMRGDGDGKLQPCHHKAFRRYDIILSSVGAGSWRAAMPVRGTDGPARADELEPYLAALEAWIRGPDEGAGGELASRVQALLEAPDEPKRFLASLLASLLRAQQLSARQRVGQEAAPAEPAAAS